jgi:O-antigen/teichoic acid export membrane protein
LTTAATFTTLAIRTVLYPNISNWSAHNQYSRIEYSLTKGFTYSLLLALPVFVGGLLLGDRLLYFFYGASFVQGTQALYILLAAQVANVFMFLQTMCLNAMNRPKDSFKITAVASIANILMNLILIPDLGITGASIATLLSITLNAVLAYYILRKIIKVQVEYSSLRNILISLAVMGMFIGIYCLIVPLSTVWLTLIPILVGGIIYGVILIKLDKKIYNELQDILVKMGIVSPQ